MGFVLKTDKCPLCREWPEKTRFWYK